MALLIKNVRAIDPQIGLDSVVDIIVRDGVVAEVGSGLSVEKGIERDCTGKILVPGLVDMHARTPA